MDYADYQHLVFERRPNGVVENGISCFGCHGPVGMMTACTGS